MAFGQRLINAGAGGVPPFELGVDGQYMATSDNLGNVYVSNDFGSNFYLTGSIPDPAGGLISISEQGNHIQVLSNEGNSSKLYHSSDFGATFTYCLGGLIPAMAASWDGTLVGVMPTAEYGINMKVYGGYGEGSLVDQSGGIDGIRFSRTALDWSQTNFLYGVYSTGGQDYIARRDSSGNYTYQGVVGASSITSIATGEGSIVYASTNTSLLKKSTNSAVSFSSLTNPANSGNIACNYSANILVKSTGSIWVSTNSGGSFTNKSLTNAGHIKMSSSGQYICANNNNDSVYVSNDSGSTFSVTSVAPNIGKVAVARKYL